ncbi:ankyrin repeat domain-containing protein [Fimbriiglobus ruber]|uniref:Ankyrin repeat protein n=1 Tax=Fimbriiglobus ruber TaxID=1908690 RepID=A0A225DNB2_9BACT|nr:ankyrin repeat domain-containing protein [Fimbriiglobus ruber]OWK37815.1 Ankyrin repeat protein [Fimbriiglobus ruber]
MTHRLLAIVGLFSVTLPAYAADPKKAVDPAVAFIDQLEKLDTQDTGYAGSVSGSSFLPLGYSSASVVLLSPAAPTGKSEAMLSLVKLGSKAVPALLDHLADDRRTRIVIRNSLYGFFGISQDRGERAEDVVPNGNGGNPLGSPKQYTLRVGDLCYVALGQIVNCDYTAVEYIPSGIVGIVSVPHSRKLRADLKKQWGGLTEKKHLASLVKDLNVKKPKGDNDDGDRARVRASLRLAYYFPKEYESIAVEQLKKPTRNFIDALQYVESEKLDRALRDLMAETDDLQVSFALVDRLAGRGYDADIEAFVNRRLPKVAGEDRRYIEDFRDKLGFTRLHIAVEVRSSYLIEAALKTKADVNARSKDGRTALHVAAAQDAAGTVDLLLNAKADANLKDNDGRTPMEYAASQGHSDLVRRLAKVQTEPLGFFSAVILGKAERVKELLKAKPELVKARTRQGNGWTPLQIAAREGHEETVRALLDAGGDVNGAKGAKGEISPLVWAVWTERPNIKLVKLLIERGADVNQHGGWGSEAPLHHAVKYGNVELVKLLLEAKADPAVTESFGKTPLDLAKEKNNQVIVKMLTSAK